MTYWMAFAESGIKTETRNRAIAYFTEKGLGIGDFMENEAEWDSCIYKDVSVLSDDDKVLLREAKSKLANYGIKCLDMSRQGYEMIPVAGDERFPKKLKDYLKFSTPTILYAKGNMDLLSAPMTAIVGSRNASTISLDFTANVARKVVGSGKIVVSGFAKGVDQMASAAALEVGGSTVLVLPQGICTAGSVFKRMYQFMDRVLCISLCPPNMPWSVGLAMERNAYIYALADEIYAAQSDNHGGTWDGVNKGLKRGDKVYVRVPGPTEKCANMELISRGAKPVDKNGDETTLDPSAAASVKPLCTAEQIIEAAQKLLETKTSITAADVIKHLNCSNKNITDVLKKSDLFDVMKVRQAYAFTKKQASLF